MSEFVQALDAISESLPDLGLQYRWGEGGCGTGGDAAAKAAAAKQAGDAYRPGRV
jgi:hypothetical protein